jgi:hypothetical protein
VPVSMPSDPRPERPWFVPSGKECCVAVVGVVLAVTPYLLPPLGNSLAAQLLHVTRQPVATLCVAGGFIIFRTVARKAQTRLIPIVTAAIVLALLTASVVPLTLYWMATSQARGIRAEVTGSPGWASVTTKGFRVGPGQGQSAADVWGAGQYQIVKGALDLTVVDNRSAVQSYFPYNAGNRYGTFYAEAQADIPVDNPGAGCGLVFGFQDPNNTYVFWVEPPSADGGTGYDARVVQMMDTPSESLSGFHQRLDGQVDGLPYVDVGTWLPYWPADRLRLAIYARGDLYQFFVDDRRVMSLPLLQVPNHEVSVAVIDHDATTAVSGDVQCSFDYLRIWEQR